MYMSGVAHGGFGAHGRCAWRDDAYARMMRMGDGVYGGWCTWRDGAYGGCCTGVLCMGDDAHREMMRMGVLHIVRMEEMVRMKGLCA